MARRRLALALAVAAVVAGAASAGAAGPAPVVLTDLAGDANGINDQGVVPQSVEFATAPASYGGLDFTRVSLTSVGTAKACRGFILSMEFAAPVDPSVPAIYRLQGDADGNGVFQIYLDNAVGHGSQAVVRHGVGDEDRTTPLRTPARITGNKIQFIVTAADLKVFHGKAGTMIASLNADTRLTVGSPVPVAGPAPADNPPTQAFPLQVDGVRPLERSFTICG